MTRLSQACRGRPRGFLLACLSLLASACADDLPQATEIARMRVLGARVEVLGDEARATPRPGERVRLTLPTVFPSIDESVADVQTLLIRCTAPTQFTGGLPICQEFLDAALGDTADVAAALDTNERFACGVLPISTVDFMGVTVACLTGQPDAELLIPPDFATDTALYLGIVCEDGVPFLDPTEPSLFGCDGDGEAIVVNGQITVLQDDAQENLNPSLDAAVFLMDDGPWPAWDPNTPFPPVDNCNGVARRLDDDPLRASDVGDHEITIQFDPRAREIGPDGEPERVEITVHATVGDIERRFTLFDAFDEPLPDESEEGPAGWFVDTLEWDPWDPKRDDDLRAEGRGLLVRFFVTLRDGRGGFAMQTRAVCLDVPRKAASTP